MKSTKKSPTAEALRSGADFARACVDRFLARRNEEYLN